MREGEEERSKVIFLHAPGDVSLSLAFLSEQGQHDPSGACQWASCPVTAMSLAFLLLSPVALMPQGTGTVRLCLACLMDRADAKMAGPGLSLAD